MVIVSGSLEEIYKQLFSRINKQQYHFNCNWGHPAMLNDVVIEYVGTTDGIYPPYHLNKNMIGSKFKLWAGVSGCNFGYVDKTGGCFNLPEKKYIFKCDITQVDV